MEREIQLKVLYYEIIRNWKIIITISVIGAVIFGICLAVYDSAIKPAQLYGAKTRFTIEREMLDIYIGASNDKDFNAIVNTQDSVEKCIAIITSDEVIKKAIEEVELINGLEVEDVRNMLHPWAKENAGVIELNVVAENQKMATLICKTVMMCSIEQLDERGFQIEVTQDVTSLGTVTTEAKVDTSEPRNNMIIVTQVPQEQDMSAMEIVIKSFFGFIIIACLTIFLLFLFFLCRDRVVYAEQIDETIGLKLLSDFKKNMSCWEFYTTINFEGDRTSVIAFVSLCKMNTAKDFINEVAANMNTVGNSVVIIKCVDGCGQRRDSLFADKNGYDYIEISEKDVLQKNFFKEMIAKLSKTYDIILLACEETNKTFTDKIICKEADKVIVLVEADTVKLKDLYEMKNLYEQINVKVEGAIFLG